MPLPGHKIARATTGHRSLTSKTKDDLHFSTKVLGICLLSVSTPVHSLFCKDLPPWHHLIFGEYCCSWYYIFDDPWIARFISSMGHSLRSDTYHDEWRTLLGSLTSSVLGHVIMPKVIKKIMYILIMKVCELGKLEWDIANKAKSRFQAHMATNRETCSFFCNLQASHNRDFDPWRASCSS